MLREKPAFEEVKKNCYYLKVLENGCVWRSFIRRNPLVGCHVSFLAGLIRGGQ